MSSGEGKVVCVTGGSGYIASWLVKYLLERGYTINAAVRDPTDPKKTAHLLALEGAKERLHLFKADLLEEGSFDPAIGGCVGVFHSASPVPRDLETVNPQVELIDPALKGTLNVLRSCAKVPSIKRVILTASVATTLYNGTPLTPDVVVDETWYSDPVVAEGMKLWYALAKTLAEKAAWKFAEENKIDLVSLHPGWVLGPLLQPTLNSSVEIISSLLSGAETYPKLHFKSVDVRDVAIAHIQAFENSSASGRYILVEGGLFISEILEIVHQLYPALSLPQKCGVETRFIEYAFSQEKAKTLGINFTPLEVTLKDTIESLKEKGFLSF